MALVHIKKRQDPIVISNERARKIKVMRFGTEANDYKDALDPRELIDLGDLWAGEIGEIKGIELTPDSKPAPIMSAHDRKIEEVEAELAAMPIEQRVDAIGYGFFKLHWWMRSGRKEEESKPREEIMDMARKAGLDYLKSHPSEVSIPAKVYEPIFMQHWGEKKEEVGGLSPK